MELLISVMNQMIEISQVYEIWSHKRINEALVETIPMNMEVFNKFGNRLKFSDVYNSPDRMSLIY